MKRPLNEQFPYFDEIKRHLAITWNDDDTDQLIRDYIVDGENHLKSICGDFSIDFNTDIEAKRLLKEYCRYARNFSIEAFNHNFSDELLRLRLKYAIKEYG